MMSETITSDYDSLEEAVNTAKAALREADWPTAEPARAR